MGRSRRNRSCAQSNRFLIRSNNFRIEIYLRVAPIWADRVVIHSDGQDNRHWVGRRTFVLRCIEPYWDVLSHLDTIIVYFPTAYHYRWTVTQLCGLPCHLVFIVRNIRLQLPHYAFFLLIKADVTALSCLQQEAGVQGPLQPPSALLALALSNSMWLTLLCWHG